MWRTLSLFALAFAGGTLASPAAAKDCSDLAQTSLANGKVTSTMLVAAGAFQQAGLPGTLSPGVANAVYRDLPPFCRVQATLTPTADSDIKVEVWLPVSGWNGKLVGIGNGVWAGQLSYSQLADPLKRGYAVATTDTGHTGTGLSAEFAKGHPEKLIDFGYRAVHEMVVAGKTMVNAFYGSGPKASYWNSCSTGGRQGLMQAYRYPADFDAISAMAPANPMTDLMTQSMWVGWQPQRQPGAAVSVPELAMIHRAVIARCDKLDGLADGIVGRPDACRFDPALLLCKSGESDQCLTALQVDTMKAIYAGVPDRKGHQLLPGWPVGSEMQLAALTQGQSPFPVALTYFSMLVFGDRPAWDWRAFDYQRDTLLSRKYGGNILNVPPTGLQPFFARGGKLLLSHGWTDGLIPANNTLAFYRALSSSLAARQAQQQLRLFMVPGMDHCAGGEGASQFDTLGAIDGWSTTGVAPERIIATRPTVSSAPGAAPRPPLSRPLCPYPLYAEYGGEGDVAAAESFRCVAPRTTKSG